MAKLGLGVMDAAIWAQVWLMAHGGWTALRWFVSALWMKKKVGLYLRKWAAITRLIITPLLAREDVRAVMIATPPFLHIDPTIAAAQAGVHVFCEKPMSPTLAGCDDRRV